MTRGRAVTVGVLVLVGLGVTAAKESAQEAQPGARGAQEAEVVAVYVDPQVRQPFILLRGKRDRRQVLMAIGHLEAERIAIPLQGVTPPRPLTHDLILSLLGDLKAALKRVIITDLRDDVYYALLDVEIPGSLVRVDSRPSDAIALALRAKVPILVEERVFDKAERLMPKPGATPHF
jgi:bifunctional DNase/RNase